MFCSEYLWCSGGKPRLASNIQKFKPHFIYYCPRRNSTAAGSTCVFVSFFAFGEGAKPGEAGVVAFYNLAP